MTNLTSLIYSIRRDGKTWFKIRGYGLLFATRRAADGWLAGLANAHRSFDRNGTPVLMTVPPNEAE